jgi:hypothetical protein
MRSTPTTCPRPAPRGALKWTWLAALVVLPAAALPARAGHLDLKLIEYGHKLIELCRDRGYKNVGVLKFGVRVGKRGAAGPVEPLSSSLADRVENLLVLANNLEQPIGVIHAAGEVAAARDARAGFRTARDREKLFAHSYPLAWGTARVKPDAFLTGLVEVAADLQSAKVTLEALTRKSGPVVLFSFKVQTDRSLLADAGLPFSLEQRGKLSLEPAAVDRQAIASARTLRQLGGSSRSAAALVRLSVLVGDKEQPLRPTTGVAGESLVRRPRPGSRLALKLKNFTGHRVGVVLKVAGRNTLNEQVDEPVRCRMWILDPYKGATVRGYYTAGEKLTGEPRRFTAPDGAARGQLASALPDLIEVAVFVSAARPDPRPVVSLRGLSPQERAGIKAPDLKDLQRRLKRRGGLKVRLVPGTKRSILVPDEPRAAPLPPLTLANPALVEYRRVRFENPP